MQKGLLTANDDYLRLFSLSLIFDGPDELQSRYLTIPKWTDQLVTDGRVERTEKSALLLLLSKLNLRCDILKVQNNALFVVEYEICALHDKGSI